MQKRSFVLPPSGIMVQALEHREDAPPIPRMMLIPADQATVIDTWQMAGMAATGSNDIVAEDVFVPEGYQFAVPDCRSGRGLGREIYGSGLYGSPMLPNLCVTASIPALGAAREAVNQLRERLKVHVKKGSGGASVEKPAAQMRLARADLLAKAAERTIRACARENLEIGDVDEPEQTTERIRLRAEIAIAVQQCVEAVRTCCEAAGSSIHALNQRITGDGQAANEAIGSTLTPATLAALTARLGGEENLPELEDFTDHEVRQVIGGDLLDRQFGLSSRLEWTLAGGNTLRWIAGYRDYRNLQFDEDVIYLREQLLARETLLASESFSHELQFLSPEYGAFGGNGDFVVGAYYYSEDLELGESLSLTSDFCNLLAPSPVRPACLNNPLSDASDLLFLQDSESFAVFGQAEYHLLDSLSAQVGARYTWDDRTGSFDQQTFNPFLALAVRAEESTDLSFSDEKFTYRLGLNWEPNEDILVFSSYSTGYKAGGFNSGGGATPLTSDERTFDSEEAKNYELGIKTSFLDRRLLFNTTLYRTELDNFHDRSFDGVSFLLRNAGSLRHQGVEMEASMAVARNFKINVSGAYLDSEFTSFPGATAFPGCGPSSPAIPGCGPIGGNRGVQDLTGGRNNFAPEFSGSINAYYDGDIGGGWSYRLSGSLSYVGEQFVGGVTDNNPQTIEDDYALTSARLALYSPGDRFEFAAFGDNIFDVGYCSQRYYQALGGAFGLNQPETGFTMLRCIAGAPATYGASVTARF